MYQIYLVGSIGKLTYKEATQWREYVTERLQLLWNDKVLVKDPMRFKSHLDSNEKVLDFVYDDTILCSAKSIVARDLNDVRYSDLLFAYLDSDLLSIGSAMEIAIAYEHKIPVLGVFSKDNNNIYNKHPFIQEMVSYKVFDLDEGIELVGKVL